MDKLLITKAMSLKEVKALTTFSTATIYRKIKTDNFPKQIQVSKKRVVWDGKAIIEWLNHEANKYNQ